MREKNPQLMIYGLGILDMAEMLFPVETVRLTIFQPRLSNSSTWEIAPEALKAWGNEVLRPAGELALKGEGDLKRWKLVSVLQSKIYLQAESQGKSEAGANGV